MGVIFRCENCSATLKLYNQHRGESTTCPNCGRSQEIPHSAEEFGTVSRSQKSTQAVVIEAITAPDRGLAERSDRLAAAIIDALITLATFIPIWIAGNAASLATRLIALIPFWVVVVIQLVQLGIRGQTIGKMTLKIKIVRQVDGSEGGFVHNVWWRTVFNSILALFPFYALVDILYIFRTDRRCLHDLIADTKVIRIEEAG